MSTREIVTLQIGHYSNFVGSHWWNSQEASFIYDPNVAAKCPKEVDHDVLYREGRTVRGETTFTPRLVSFDLYHSLGSMKREGILYDMSTEDDVRWDGDVALHQESSFDKNPYLLDLEKAEEDRLEPREIVDTKLEEMVSDSKDDDATKPEVSGSGSKRVYHLDDKVKVWSDYLRTSLHPRTVNLIKEYQHANPEQPFDVFNNGELLFSKREQLDAMEDNVRFFTEECDYLQGFQILMDSHNAFGGFALPILRYLEDEYHNKARLTLALTPARPPDQTARERSCRTINSTLSLDACCKHTDLTIPLSLASRLYQKVGDPLAFPGLQYKADLNYHTSAIIAAALDTFSLPYRQQGTSFRLSHLTQPFSAYGRSIAALNVAMPLPLSSQTSFADYLLSLEDRDPWMSLTPHVSQIKCPTIQSCSLRGLSSSRHHKLSSKAQREFPQFSSIDELLDLYLRQTYRTTLSTSNVIQTPLNLDPSFPHIFKDSIDFDGLQTAIPRPASLGVESIPMMTSLQSGKEISQYVTDLSSSASRLDLSKHHHFITAGLDPDDFTETKQSLTDLAQMYENVGLN